MPSDPALSEQFKFCSTCRKPIAFGAGYYACSVTTCNRKRTGLFFCSVPCWDAHVPVLRHRDAWAETARAPTREAFLAELAAERDDTEPKDNAMTEKPKERRIVGAQPDDLPDEVLVVVSKLKAYIRARSGMNTSDGVVDVLSRHLRGLCDRAVGHASLENRKTVMDRDFEAILKS